jgi:Arc/MetJ-type ribon-helix-helix transcriptional regulator
MKTASLPAVRVPPELRAQLEQALHTGESLSAFVEASVREALARRVDQAEFLQRGLASLADAKASSDTVRADAVLQSLAQKLDAARQARAARR